MDTVETSLVRILNIFLGMPQINLKKSKDLILHSKVVQTNQIYHQGRCQHEEDWPMYIWNTPAN